AGKAGGGPTTVRRGGTVRGALMVCGTTSDAGKSHVVTGLCRLLARRGVKVAPFKAQNMALNSYVTPSGHEIGRAQGVQALAAGVEPEVAMNPILLKPTGDRTSQVVVNGAPIGHMSAAEYHDRKPQLLGLVLEALEDLRRRFDVVIAEGAGSPAEINLLDHDIVNLRVASEAGLPAVVVGDIDRGGVFAALYGTVALLPDSYRRLVRGFVINKFRGDPALLAPGLIDLEGRCGVPTLGVLPWVHDVALDAEDSLSLSGARPRPVADAAAGAVAGELDVAALRLPRLANFTDLDALAIEPGVSVRLVDSPGALGDPDLLVVPGTKATVSDLEWLRARRFDGALAERLHAGTTVLGVCGGYQMLGTRIVDHVESCRGEVAALGWLDAETVFEPEKLTRQRRGAALGARVTGYEIRHGRTVRGPGADPWVELDDAYGSEAEGARRNDGPAVFGTSLHGIFEADGFRAAFLAEVADRRGKRFVPAGVSFAAARQVQFDRLADLLEGHLDLAALETIMAGARPVEEQRWTEGVRR
ncbi:MAG TPA: cobyric acid synthase, partial [Acidimicrobiales bacterium]|nr:cobyric acid synthase [Acidimicrobiales bacterium]